MTGVERRLRSYWLMEAANVLIVPAAAVAASLYFGGGVSPALVAAAAAASFLLVIGTIYLRAAHRQSRREAGPLRYWIPILAALQPAAALAVLAAAAVVGWEIATHTPRLAVERIVALVCLILAALEYVNYYHVQLQHFDNAADWRRLTSGKGFRQAPMARDIARWRRDRVAGKAS